MLDGCHLLIRYIKPWAVPQTTYQNALRPISVRSALARDIPTDAADRLGSSRNRTHAKAIRTPMRAQKILKLVKVTNLEKNTRG
jgi:hypothetical protein